MKTDDPGYGEYKDRQAEISRQRSAAGRDIGTIPPIKNIRRRSKTKKNLKLFCQTYNPEAFYLPWSSDQNRSIARIEEAAINGALYAFAEPRGSGKTTRVRMAALWAIAHNWRRYAFVIGANADKAGDTLDAIKVYCRFLPLFVEDFPEIAWAVIQLRGIANRASGQTCNGQSTMIEWSRDRIVLPTVPPPPNWPKSWKLRDDGMAPTSGAVIGTSGLTGDGIRGSLLTLTTGEAIRPDFVLLDDPQTHESANSQTQNNTREQLVSADVLGMAGPDRAISAVMPCTVIEKGDFADRILDRNKHPMWRGERSRMLRSMPKDLAVWDPYFEIYRRCALSEPPNFTESNEYYLANRSKLDDGAEAGWPERKLDWEISAIQHAMHLLFRDRRAFMSEYQNDPEPDVTDVTTGAVTVVILTEKISTLPRLIVPRDCNRLTSFIDVGSNLLWWMVCAWNDRFGGAIIDAGVFPEQGRSYFAKASPGLPLGDLPQFAGQSQDAAIYGGLRITSELILGRRYRQEETGAELTIDRCLVDANWGPATDLVYDFCRRSSRASVITPSHGKFIGASSAPMATWKPKPNQRLGWNWILSAPEVNRGRHLTFDTNHFKTFATERLRTPEGATGCMRIFSPSPGEHRMLIDHLTAEYPVIVGTEAGRKVGEWKLKPNRDNDWFDCLVGCCVGASYEGLKWSAASLDDSPRVNSRPPKKSLAERFRAKNPGR
jgi:hypothetical protein